MAAAVRSECIEKRLPYVRCFPCLFVLFRGLRRGRGSTRPSLSLEYNASMVQGMSRLSVLAFENRFDRNQESASAGFATRAR